MNDLYPSLYTAYRWLVPPQLNLADVCVHRWAQNTHEGRSPAVYYETETDTNQREVWTYTRVSETAQRLANGLQHMQVAPGDRVALVMTQRPEALVALAAILSLGAVAVPLSGAASTTSLRACLLDTAARVAIVDAACAARVFQAQCPQLKQVVALDFQHDNAIAWRTLLARQSATFKTLATASKDAALCLYPNEAAAHPVGILLPHAALIGALPGFVAAQNWFPHKGDVFWAADWNSCGYWIGGCLAAWYFGRPVLAAPHHTAPAQVLDVLARYRISNAYLPADLAIQIANEVDLLEQHGDALTLRALAIQGMPLPPVVVERYQTALGLTPNLCWSEPQAAVVLGESHLKWPGRAGSLGRAYPGHRLGVLDDAGSPCPVATFGTLAVHRSDVQGTPDPLLPLAHASTQDVWTPLTLRARVDKDGYFWPEQAQTG